jgi:hypothetical protein
MNSLLHHLQTVFHDPLPNIRRPTMSQTIRKGQAMFSTKKCILGWDINTSSMTLQLLESRLKSLQQHLTTTVQKKRVSLTAWR